MHVRYSAADASKPELQEDLLKAEILRCEIAESDYIIIKIAEAIADGDVEEAERIRREHAGTIAQRKELRRQINEIKARWEH